MYEVKRSISQTPGANGTCELLVKVSVGGKTPFVLQSGLYIKPVYFIRDHINLFYKRPSNKEELRQLQAVRADYDRYYNRVLNIVRVSYGYVDVNKDWVLNIIEQVDGGKIVMKGDWITFDNILSASGRTLDSHYRVKEYRNLYDYFSQYLMTHRRSEATFESYHALSTMLCRFELYQQLVLGKSKFSLDIDVIRNKDIEDFRFYCRQEGDLYQKHEEQFKRIIELADLRVPRLKVTAISNRSANQMISHLRQLKALCKFLVREERETDNYPFDEVEIGDYELNRQPICLTKNEIMKIKRHVFEEDSILSSQRDIFVFQCVSGCRYRDMICLTESNIKDRSLSYKPIPTVKENIPAVPFAQLDQWCCDAIARHKGKDWKNRLFPFFSKRRYETFVKMILKECQINRIVFVHNPKGKEEAKPLYEAADCRLAVQTFWYGHGFDDQSQDENLNNTKIKNVVIGKPDSKPTRKSSAEHRGIDDSLLKAAMITIE